MNADIIIATGNAGKLTEIRHVLSDLPFVMHSLKEYWDPLPNIPEEGATFFENARQKARWVFSRTGIMSLADDSGLEVDFLQGQPGVRSARFAGEPASEEKNLEKLLGLLSGCPEQLRQARFRCVVVLITSEHEEITAEGICDGAIDFVKHGDNGFGYDPVFVPRGFKQTFGELDASTKNGISHRGKALLHLKEKLHDRFSRHR